MRISSDGPLAEHDAEPDLSDPHFFGTGDPHPVWARMRRDDPVHRQCPAHGRPEFWAVTRYADVSRVLGRHGEFTVSRGNILTTLGQIDIAGGKMLAVTDPPLHKRLKDPLAPHLGRQAVREFEPRLREFSQRLLSVGARQDTWDFAAQAEFYPIAIAGLLLGIHCPARAQSADDRFSLERLITGSIGSLFGGGAGQSAPAGSDGWSGESGSSGHPLMQADAIRAAAAKRLPSIPVFLPDSDHGD